MVDANHVMKREFGIGARNGRRIIQKSLKL